MQLALLLAPSLAILFASGLRAQSKLFDWSGPIDFGLEQTVVRGVADLDGDARSDVLIGMPNKTAAAVPGAGRVEVRSGATGMLVRVHEAGALSDDGFGDSVCALGDVDGDGRGDYAIGMPQIHDSPADPLYALAGAVFVYSGASGALLGFGSSAALAGDLNGDGNADMLLARNYYGASAYSTKPLALTASTHQLSASSGGTQTMSLASVPHAGQLYLVAATGSNTTPGTSIDGVLIPLNVDAFTLFSLQSANQPPYQQTLGLLGAGGTAQAALALPAGLATSLVGTTLLHAFVVFNGAVVFASNAVPLTFEP